MKHVKMLGLAALAAMAVMAFVASSASATALYNGSGTKLGVGSTIEATLTAGSAPLTSTSGTLLDTAGAITLSVSISNAGGTGASVLGNITTFDLEPSTEPTSTSTKGSLEISQIGTTTNGTVVGKGTVVNVATTIFAQVCEYTTGGGTDLGELKGATGTGHATLAINTVLQAKNSFFCPDTVWKASFTITNPVGLHVEAS